MSRQLDYLPDHDDPLNVWRDWLTAALCRVPGTRIADFVRHGRNEEDPCELVVLVPGGGRRAFSFDRQGLLMRPGGQRTMMASITDGLIGPRSLTKAEHEDIWIALVMLATVTVDQSQAEETADWLDQFVAVSEPIVGHTLHSEGRLDALRVLLLRPRFGRIAALDVDNPRIEHPVRPAQLIDMQTDERWFRASELAAHWRHALGISALSWSSITSRLRQIGVERFYMQVRRGGEHPNMVLYRISPDSDEMNGGETP